MFSGGVLTIAAGGGPGRESLGRTAGHQPRPARPTGRDPGPRRWHRHPATMPTTPQGSTPNYSCALTRAAVPLHQLKVRVQPLTAANGGLLDEHVATTLHAPADGKPRNTESQLPQQRGPTQAPQAAKNPTSQPKRRSVTAPQTRKTGLA